MPVKYSLVELSNPLRPEDSKMFYAKAQADGVVTLNEIAEDVSYASSLTDGDVLNSIRGVIRCMRKHLSNGRVVSLGELGSFQLQISSSGASTKEEFNAANIRKAKFQFRPGTMLRDLQRNITYERVGPLPQRKKKEE